jgi:hypothetical protein
MLVSDLPAPDELPDLDPALSSSLRRNSVEDFCSKIVLTEDQLPTAIGARPVTKS